MIFGPSFRVSLANSALLTLIAASMAALLLTSLSCGLLDDDGGSVTVGTVMPVSGDLSTLGPAAQSSMSLAFDLINEAGGVNGSQIEVFHRDSGTNATLGADAASGLVNNSQRSVADISGFIIQGNIGAGRQRYGVPYASQ